MWSPAMQDAHAALALPISRTRHDAILAQGVIIASRLGSSRGAEREDENRRRKNVEAGDSLPPKRTRTETAGETAISDKGQGRAEKSRKRRRG